VGCTLTVITKAISITAKSPPGDIPLTISKVFPVENSRSPFSVLEPPCFSERAWSHNPFPSGTHLGYFFAAPFLFYLQHTLLIEPGMAASFLSSPLPIAMLRPAGLGALFPLAIDREELSLLHARSTFLPPRLTLFFHVLFFFLAFSSTLKNQHWSLRNSPLWKTTPKPKELIIPLIPRTASLATLYCL